MLYLNEEHIKQIGIDWNKTIKVIENTVKCLVGNDYSQPIKPYLRYGDLKNRIIAMPAYVGGDINTAGIKWIASFPDNINNGIPRAHSVIILNSADSGKPIGILNTALLSIIRTASVSGLIIKHFMNARENEKVKLGIVGFGPIGQYHLKMCLDILGDKLDQVCLYDIKGIDREFIAENSFCNIIDVDNWKEAYVNSDIFITCSVSKYPYIDIKPKSGSLHLNVSLRDYTTKVYEWFKDAIIVDEWEEVCRERTDIEMMHIEKGLMKEHTFSIKDIIIKDFLSSFKKDIPIMFNPMGMAVFDIGIGQYYFQEGLYNNTGFNLT